MAMRTVEVAENSLQEKTGGTVMKNVEWNGGRKSDPMCGL